MNPRLPPTPAAAYRRALYCVQLAESELVLCAGRRDRHADAVLHAAGVRRRWAIVTPCNPRSRRLAESENARRLHRFHTDLACRGWFWIPAVNRDPDRRWPDEPGALLADVGQDCLLAFADHYGQAAILLGELGKISSIIYL